jgi:hypothetical protein
MELVALVLILLAQAYRIIRSELLLHQERELHKAMKEHLNSLTPAGLLPQYKALKEFHGQLLEQVQAYEAELEGIQQQLVNQTTEAERLLLEEKGQATELDHLRSALKSRDDQVRLIEESVAIRELQNRAQNLRTRIGDGLPFYSEVIGAPFLERLFDWAKLDHGIDFHEHSDIPISWNENQEGNWCYEILSDHRLRIYRWPPAKETERVVTGPRWNSPQDRPAFEQQVEQEFKKAIGDLL